MMTTLKRIAAVVGVQMVAAAVDETVRVKIRNFFKKGAKTETEEKKD